MLKFPHLLPLAAAIGLAAGPSFDVAPVKAVPFTAGSYHANLGTAVHGKVNLTNTTLSESFRFAFGINNDDQVAGPDWIKSREFRFNIVAKAPPETPLPELRLMLQNLLAERFRMTLHHEKREHKYLVLADADASDKPSIYDALREQLGLTLESTKGLLDTIVVDRADKVPVGN